MTNFAENPYSFEIAQRHEAKAAVDAIWQRFQTNGVIESFAQLMDYYARVGRDALLTTHVITPQPLLRFAFKGDDNPLREATFHHPTAIQTIRAMDRPGTQVVHLVRAQRGAEDFVTGAQGLANPDQTIFFFQGNVRDVTTGFMPHYEVDYAHTVDVRNNPAYVQRILETLHNRARTEQTRRR